MTDLGEGPSSSPVDGCTAETDGRFLVDIGPYPGSSRTADAQSRPPEQSVIQCPCHNSEFDVANGAVLGGPAPTPLKEFTVEISGSTGTITM